MNKKTKNYNYFEENYEPEPIVEEAKQEVAEPKVPSELELRQKICEINHIQWEYSIALLSAIDFDTFIKRRLIHRAKWGK